MSTGLTAGVTGESPPLCRRAGLRVERPSLFNGAPLCRRAGLRVERPSLFMELLSVDIPVLVAPVKTKREYIFSPVVLYSSKTVPMQWVKALER